MLPFGDGLADLAEHIIRNPRLSDIREQVVRGHQASCGSCNSLRSVEGEQARAVVTECWPFHCEIAGWRRKEAHLISVFADRIRVMMLQRLT